MSVSLGFFSFFTFYFFYFFSFLFLLLCLPFLLSLFYDSLFSGRASLSPICSFMISSTFTISAAFLRTVFLMACSDSNSVFAIYWWLTPFSTIMFPFYGMEDTSLFVSFLFISSSSGALPIYEGPSTFLELLKSSSYPSSWIWFLQIKLLQISLISEKSITRAFPTVIAINVKIRILIVKW